MQFGMIVCPHIQGCVLHTCRERVFPLLVVLRFYRYLIHVAGYHLIVQHPFHPQRIWVGLQQVELECHGVILYFLLRAGNGIIAYDVLAHLVDALNKCLATNGTEIAVQVSHQTVLMGAIPRIPLVVRIVAVAIGAYLLVAHPVLPFQIRDVLCLVRSFPAIIPVFVGQSGQSVARLMAQRFNAAVVDAIADEGHRASAAIFHLVYQNGHQVVVGFGFLEHLIHLVPFRGPGHAIYARCAKASAKDIIDRFFGRHAGSTLIRWRFDVEHIKHVLIFLQWRLFEVLGSMLSYQELETIHLAGCKAIA